jgi:hypothetical protein
MITLGFVESLLTFVQEKFVLLLYKKCLELTPCQHNCLAMTLKSSTHTYIQAALLKFRQVLFLIYLIKKLMYYRTKL